MERDPLVSAVVPVFNGRKYLPQALASIQAQTLTDWELIVIDDGSTDGSGKVALEQCPRARVIRNRQNRGLGWARNQGALVARGLFVTYLSADDLWDPTFLERAVDAAFRSLGTVQFARYRFIDEVGNAKFSLVVPDFQDAPTFRRKVWEWAEARNCFVNFSATLFPRWLFDEVRFEADLKFNEDLMFLLRSMHRADYRLLPQELASYRLHPEQLTRRVESRIPEQVEGIIQRARKELREVAA